MLGATALGQALLSPTSNLTTSASFQRFSLVHLESTLTATQLRLHLGAESGATVATDPISGDLLIQGTPQQLIAVEQWLQKTDRPANLPASRSQDSDQENFLKAYAVSEGRVGETAHWATTFQAPKGASVAFDQRTRQLLVMGPNSLHQFVANQLAPRPATTASSTPRNAARVLDRSEEQSNSILSSRLTLQHTTGDALHAYLEQLLARSLPATLVGNGQWLSFKASLSPDSDILIEAHRTSGELRLSGTSRQVAGWSRVLLAVDSPATPGNTSVTHLLPTHPASVKQVRQTLQVIQAQGDKARLQGQFASTQTQPATTQPAQTQPATTERATDGTTLIPAPTASDPASPATDASSSDDETLLGPVRVEFVEGLDIIVIRGNKRDVARVQEIINKIERVSAETVPSIEVLPMQHVDSESMARILDRVYSQVLGPRTGSVSITPLGKPNALLLVGRSENVKTAIDLVKRLDVPVEPTTRFEVFPLKYAIAGDAKELIDSFLADREGENQETAILSPKAMIVADFRTNSLFVNAGPRDLVEIATMVQRIDVDRATAIDEVRIFPLKNVVAEDLAEVLRSAVLAREAGDNQNGGEAASARMSALRFLTIDPENRRRLESGILSGISITAEAQANSLVVTAPTESMELIAALIEQLDHPSEAEAQIKVFTIVNGDANSLVTMLRSLFGDAEAGEGANFGASDNALVRLQLSVDDRTNSIIAAGTPEDLSVVYALLLQLDSSDLRLRKTEVYRLKNSPAEEVAAALNEWLQTEREAEAAADLTISPYEQIEREVIIVPETVSNSLIVSATPEYFEEIADLIDQLDERPAMVMIQVLIAEVRLNDTDEFGVEIGLQDSLLFDRSVLDNANFNTITETVQDQSPGGATVSTTSQTIINSPTLPGFNFNNQPLGNNASTRALAGAANVATQGLSNFALNRVNSELGFGGFVFSASSNSVSMLLRALQENRRLEVLSRPQIMALDNQIGSVSVGQRVPRIESTNITQFGQQNTVVYEDVGIMLEVRPRISPDGMVVMEVRAEKSEVGSEQDGIPIFSGLDGTVVRAPRIDQTVAETTVAASTGQTVVLSGLLTKRSFDVHRRVPLLSDIPLLGDLFRFDSVSEQRTELLIVLTPRVIRNEYDAEMLKQVESARMSWVLSDAVDLHGPSGLRSRCDEWTASDSESVYPTQISEETLLEAQGASPLESELNPKELGVAPEAEAVQPAGYRREVTAEAHRLPPVESVGGGSL